MWKTRKQKQRGGSLTNFFKKKKTPVSTNTTPLLSTTKNNSGITYGRTISRENFVAKKQKTANAAKKLRAHIQRMKAVSNNVRNQSLKMMNNNMRNRTRKLLNYKNLNSLSNDQVVELYTTGKVRSLSQ